MQLVYDLYDKGYSIDHIVKDVIGVSKTKGITLTPKSAKLFVETLIVSREKRIQKERKYFYD